MFDFNFDWKPEMDTRIESIDTQHRQLFVIGRDIEQLVRVECIGVTDKQLLDIVCRLRDYTGYHFYEEEQMMKKSDYPGLEEHRKQHVRYTTAVMKIDMPKLKANPAKELNKIKIELQTGIFNHMLTEDVQFTDYFKKQEKRQEEQAKSSQENVTRHPVYGWEICKLNAARVYLSPNQRYPGCLNMVYIEKVRDFCTLTALERNTFFADIAKASRALQKVCHADGINYGSFTDMEEQLNFQIVPKYRDQAEWGQPFLKQVQDSEVEDEERKQLYDQLKKELGV